MRRYTLRPETVERLRLVGIEPKLKTITVEPSGRTHASYANGLTLPYESFAEVLKSHRLRRRDLERCSDLPAAPAAYVNRRSTPA